MATTVCLPAGYIKIEDTPSPEPIYIPIDDPVISNTLVPVVESAPLIDPRDPEGFLKRCSGFNKSKRIKERCSAVIGKKSEQNCHPTFLPTCRAHRDQQSFAGWCQYQRADGERCGRLFRWTPPYFELCSDHQGHPDTPCYYFRLPLELRHEVLKYLLPTRPIGSSTAALHDGILDAFDSQHVQPVPRTGSFRSNNQRHHHGITPTHCHHEIPDSLFPMPALDLFLVNRQFYLEAKDLLFSTVPFTIDVRKDGTFMCGRRLLEPRRADGSSHFLVDDADEAKQRFLRYFDWAAVKHYVVDVLVENGSNGDVGLGRGVHNGWDEEVEVYDIRDYISVVVSGVLSKSHTLAKLQVRLCLADFAWSPTTTLQNAKILLGPFESLRNVRQPQIVGISTGKPNHNAMLSVQRPVGTRGSRSPICSVPALPTANAMWLEGLAEHAIEWCKKMSTTSERNLIPRSPIRAMFTSFKEFYAELANLVRDVTFIQGRHSFLHRARVAREHENVEAFRDLRNELIQYWYAYLEREERKKKNMEMRLASMLETDVYPSHEWEEASMRLPSVASSSKTKEPLPLSEILNLDSNALLRELGPGLLIQPSKREERCGEPGPSTKRRRMDSGFSEMTEVDDSPSTVEADSEEAVYVGKGKGKMTAKEVIFIDS